VWEIEMKFTTIDAGGTNAARPSAWFVQSPASTAMPAAATLETPSAAAVAPSEGAHSPSQRNVAGGQRSSTTLTSSTVAHLPSADLRPSASAPPFAVHSSPAPSEALTWAAVAPSTAIARQLDPEAVAALMDDFSAFEWFVANGGRRQATSVWDDPSSSEEPFASLVSHRRF
jgi:hypothetical protein